MDNELFVKEMKILYKNISDDKKEELESLIVDCFNVGRRAYHIIEKLREIIIMEV